MKKFYGMSASEAVSALDTNGSRGLAEHECEKRSSKYGKNRIELSKKKNPLVVFLSQFKDALIIILLLSSAISFILSRVKGENNYIDGIIILAIVLVNAFVSTIQEYSAEKSIDSLKKVTSPTAVVIRGGKHKKVDSSLLVPGDIVIMTQGDIAPADIRIIESTELTSDESMLTGESVPAEKNGTIVCPDNADISERANMIFSGCAIITGHCKGVVTATGLDTEMGKIARMLSNEESPETPMQVKLNHIGKVLGIAVLVICLIIFLLGIFKGSDIFDTLIIAISLAVAAIPEGLTAVVTIVLSLGVKRMAEHNAIIRKLSAVETLGGTHVICSDKTGTLTENKMKVVRTTGYADYLSDNSEDRRFLLLLASLCNNAEKTGNTFLGMPTEVAILKAHCENSDVPKEEFRRIGEIPFSSSRKMMTTIHEAGNGYISITKGNPKYILERCTHVLINGKPERLESFHKNRILHLNNEMASSALRVIAVAKCERDNINIPDSEFEKDLTFCGLIGIEDPPRKEAADSVRMCKKAGIVPVMVTGDQELTAVEIAKRLNILDKDSRYMTGKELSGITAQELANKISSYRVFAAVSPEDKVKIVRAFQKSGKVVAMTGDGINDAPALKAADIGCAMGINGTDVAQNAADMVLTDDNFSTIVSAVSEGRNIFVNIRNTIHFLLSCNIGEILVVFTAFLMGMPSPLLPTQLLWVNLVTDSFPALALGAGRNDDDLMEESFLKDKDNVISPQLWFSIVVEGMLIGALSLLDFTLGRTRFDVNPADPVIGRTMAFAVLCLSQLFHAFDVSTEKSVFEPGRKKNKYLKYSFLLCSALLMVVLVIPQIMGAFHTAALGLTQWLIVALLSLCPLFVTEIEKALNFRFKKRKK